MAKFDKWLTDEGLIVLEGWARSGLTNQQISKNIGIAPTTLYDWIKKFPNLSNSLKKGKEVIDYQVENALLKRALGYEYEDVKTYIEKDDKGRERKRIEKTTRHMTPDVTAQIFWLKNRMPTIWRNKVEIESNGDINKLDEIIQGIKDVANT